MKIIPWSSWSHNDAESTMSSAKTNTNLVLKTTKATTMTTSSSSLTIGGVIDLNERMHRILAFGLFVATVVLTLVVAAKVYKAVHTLKSRNKLYGYYINPKYETILVNLNRHIMCSGRSLAANLYNKRAKFVRVRKYEDDLDSEEKLSISNEKNENLASSRFESGYLNQVFELNETSIEGGESELDDDDEEDEEVDENETSRGRTPLNSRRLIFTSKSFHYRRFGNNKMPATSSSLSALHKYRVRTKRMCSNLVKNMLKGTTNVVAKHKQVALQQQRPRLDSESETTTTTTFSSTRSSREFTLPVILVTDTSSMNTIIVDFEDL